MRSILIIIVYSILFVSCSNSKYSSNYQSKNYVNQYKFFDVTGEYILEKKSLVKGNKLITKVTMRDTKGGARPVEKSVLVSSVGLIRDSRGRSRKVMKPDVSQYSIWLDSKLFFTQIKVDKVQPIASVIMKSPEKKWNGKRKVSLKEAGAYCFFTQLTECLNTYGFIKKSIKRKKGRFSLNIIRDHYPYFTEHQSSVSESLVVDGTMTYQEKKGRLHRFSLSMDGHTILYEVNTNGVLEKLFWVAQGITMEIL